MTYVLFCIGFVLLIKGADWLVNGASHIAHRFNVPPIVIGLTIVAFGTSAPELVVNVLASVAGETEIALGNVIGSNIVNTLLVLGVMAMIYPVVTKKNTTWKEIPLSILATVALGVMAHDIFFDGATTSVVSRIDGMVLLLFFSIFLYYTFAIATIVGTAGDEPPSDDQKVWQSIVLIVVGLGCLVVGGAWIVDGAVALARVLGVSEATIGLTVVAVGTSLPELATSVVAALRKKTDIAVGNVVGSSIFNIFLILGVSATISPLAVHTTFTRDILVAFFAGVILFAMMFVGRKNTIYRVEGAILATLYVAYMVAVVMQQ